MQPFGRFGVNTRRNPGMAFSHHLCRAISSVRVCGYLAHANDRNREIAMTFTGRLNLVVAYAALAFVGAIILGLF
jgi:hypothetical protein